MKKSVAVLIIFITWLALRGEALAQGCEAMQLTDAQVSEALLNSRNPDKLLRITAQVGPRAMPALRKIPPDKYLLPYFVPGAAQAALAKLGDANAFEQIVKELNQDYSNEDTAKVLTFIGNKKAISALMSYVLTHQNDKSRIVNHGDYTTDPLAWITRDLARILPESPPGSDGSYLTQQEADAWIKWWNEHKDETLVPPPASEMLSDPDLSCLARQAEWGFPDAVLLLAEKGKQDAIPALRRLALIGEKHPTTLMYQPPSYGSIRGNAQIALAKLGDQAEFDAMVNRFVVMQEYDPLDKFRYIGGQRSAEALMNALGSIPKPFEHDRDDPAYFDQELARYRSGILQILSALIKNPPLPASAAPTEANIQIWQSWWAAHKETTAFNDLTKLRDPSRWQHRWL